MRPSQTALETSLPVFRLPPCSWARCFCDCGEGFLGPAAPGVWPCRRQGPSRKGPRAIRVFILTHHLSSGPWFCVSVLTYGQSPEVGESWCFNAGRRENSILELGLNELSLDLAQGIAVWKEGKNPKMSLSL